jgi:hypothetical protein
MSGKLRRAELVGQGGVGAMSVLPNGVSIVVGGLDAWFVELPAGPPDRLIVNDLRLQLRTGVHRFILPPDPDAHSFVPVIRFPRWHFCPVCRVLQLVTDSSPGKKRCLQTIHGPGKVPFLEQAPLIAICAHGHLQDFPWFEWSHKTEAPYPDSGSEQRAHTMKLHKSGGLGLAAQRVECSCGAKRTLKDSVGGSGDGSDLSRHLLGGATRKYTCRGVRPWIGSLGYPAQSQCQEDLWGTLRSAGNVYFPMTVDSIFLPSAQSPDWEREQVLRLVELLRRPEAAAILSLTEHMDKRSRFKALKNRLGDKLGELSEIPENEIERALQLATSTDQNEPRLDWTRSSPMGQEYQVLSSPSPDLLPPSEREAENPSQGSIWLTIDQRDVKNYGSAMSSHFNHINLVPRLRVTRTLAGLTRVRSENRLSAYQKRALMWVQRVGDWLPAYVTLGEGFFLQFNPQAIHLWKNGIGKGIIRQRVEILQRSSDAVAVQRNIRPTVVLPEFVLAHTLSHLVINQLVFDCGYQAASLSERIYCNPEGEELGILIYTAAGDSDGTLGGLVRMGDQQRLPHVLARAVEQAKWCSSDPVCMEVGGETGQGPNSMNLAACHNCAMLPETSCAHYNRLLDRALVAGTLDNPSVGFLSSTL